MLVVVERDGRFLMIRRADHLENAPGYWTPAGGRIEPGESPEQAVVREMAEEVGVEVRPLRALGETDSVAELRWLTLSELRSMERVFDEDLEVMERSLQGGSA